MEGPKYRSSQNPRSEWKGCLVETVVGISDGERALARDPDNKTGEAARQLDGSIVRGD